MAGFLETAAALHLEYNGNRVSPVDFTSEFIREALTVDVTARVTVVRRGRRFTVVHVEAWAQDPGRPVAIGHGTFMNAPS